MNEQCNQVQSCFSVILWSYSYSCNHFRSIVKPTRVMWGDTRAWVWRRKLGKTAIVDSNDGNDSSGGTAQCDRKPESRLVNPTQHNTVSYARPESWCEARGCGDQDCMDPVTAHCAMLDTDCRDWPLFVSQIYFEIIRLDRLRYSRHVRAHNVPEDGKYLLRYA